MSTVEGLLRGSADGAAIGRTVLALVLVPPHLALDIRDGDRGPPSMIQRESSDVGAWIAQATSPREDQYKPVGDLGRIGQTRGGAKADVMGYATGAQAEQMDQAEQFALRRRIVG